MTKYTETCVKYDTDILNFRTPRVTGTGEENEYVRKVDSATGHCHTRLCNLKWRLNSMPAMDGQHILHL
jgi:hypothetical protein